jgi:hypothetical protein
MEVGSFGIPEVALQLLQTDMQRLDDRIRDEKFSRELYRALADNKWTKEGETVALSWKRAEELINAVRREAFEPLGWRIEPLDTSTHDPAHLSSPEDPPPQSGGRRP